ncbi:VOC family protein [Bordetella genomosp. 11]|uniref:Glyoxalase n=1 Tax=Bordetella genomosp. 11 TaxID=1416808 RepID=A0A261UEM4_9BORD|nr:VOC family protein [Bordetella genomosp. 11]OZI59680.1 glyoxalase [Bordetella genomosp. 11]
MAVRRIVTNIAAPSIEQVKRFYQALFDLDVIMDHGWLVTLSSGESALTQVSIATEGGSGTPVPDLSIEVDDVDEVYRRAKALGLDMVYELTDEPWGVRRFFVRDPVGKLVNILAHGRM